MNNAQPNTNEIRDNAARAVAALDQHLAVPFEERDYGWAMQLYNVMPHALYEVLGGITNPDDGRDYILARILDPAEVNIDIVERQQSQAPATPEEPESAPMDMHRLAHYCLVRITGCVIVDDLENRNIRAMLNFGNMWSYYEYRELGGCGNVIADFEKAFEQDPENPFGVTVSDSDEISLGEPHELFFPHYLRNIIGEEVQNSLAGATPSFSLMTEHKYAIPMRIMGGTGIDMDESTRANLQQQLSWYMPPYLPIALK